MMKTLSSAEQMELGINRARECAPTRRRQQRLVRARWWFNRMRDVVDQAMDWSAKSPTHAEQILFPDIQEYR
jgi:hypothetical protein